MELGIFAKTFNRPTLAAVFDAVREHDLHAIQFNLVSAGLPTLPDALDPALAKQIGHEAAVRGLHIAALSGTFNMIHPDEAQRREGLRRLRVLALACKPLGVSLITLCTGTRDPDNMWRAHPGNALPDAWHDLLHMMEAALHIAEEGDVVLGVEPEIGNVIDSAVKARRLLNTLSSPRLKIVMDGANLFHPGRLVHMRDVLDEAFDLLGEDIVLAHAKDVVDTDGGIGYCTAGKGALDWSYYLGRLRALPFHGPLIMHGLAEDEVEASAAYLRKGLDAEL